MPKRDKTSTAKAFASGKSSFLEKLDGAESAAVLKALMDRHPELRSEAEALGRDTLGEVSKLAVADDVEDAVLEFDCDDLNDRAGNHSWGYVEPVEAAWELLEEAVEPFVSEMKRYIEIGLEEQAREVCEGILLGLYRVRTGQENDVLGWAEDFPAESAGHALDTWMSAPASGGQRRLSPEFVREHVPDWDWVLDAGVEGR